MSASPYREGRKAADGDDAPSELEKKILSYAKVGVPLATVVIAGIAGAVQGPGATILVLAGGALIAVIAVFWASVRTLAGETPLAGADAYALGAPRAEEEQKRAVLRALKDLEFERSVGKISQEDYDALVAKYRAEAKRLLRALDESAAPRRERVEQLVTNRLRREGLLDDVGDEAPAPKPAKPAKQGKKRKKSEPAPVEIRTLEKPAVMYDDDGAEPTGPTLVSGKDRPGKDRSDKNEDKKDDKAGAACASCGTMNDADAVFCKKCGSRQSAAEASSEGGAAS